MSDKTNEEKLRILQERLASIQQKKEIQQEEKVQQNKPVAPIFEEDLVNEPKKESDVIKKKSSAWKIIFFLILFSFLGGFGYYFYSNNFKMEPTIDNIKKDFDTISDKALSLFGEEEKNRKDKDKEEEAEEEEVPGGDVTYYKSSFDGDGNFIIVLKNFEKEEFANDKANKLTEMGYDECDVLQLSGVSNSKEEVFQTYIGPFNTKGEANQYLKSDELIYKGTIFELQ